MCLCLEWRIMVIDPHTYVLARAGNSIIFIGLTAFLREIYAQRTCQPRTFR